MGNVGYDIFTYCQNNPINRLDVNGQAIAQIVAKIILGILLGIFSQLVVDILNCLVNLISNPNANLSFSARDYILSILSSILAFFDFTSPWVRIGISLLQVVLSYIGRISTPQLWRDLAIDVMFVIVSEIIGGALDRNKTKQIQKALGKVSKNKKKLSKVLKNAQSRYKEICIKEKFYALGVGITFAINISNKLFINVANILIK